MSPERRSSMDAESAVTCESSHVPLKEFSCMFSDMDHHYRTLLGTQPAIVYTLDEKGHFTFISDNIQAIGYTCNELLGRHFSAIITDDDVHQVSRDDVLPKFSGIVTGSDKAPKLFDERRTFPRKTSDLLVRMVARKKRGGTPVPSTVRGKVHAAGQYGPPGHALAGRFCGTVGVIADLVSEEGASVLEGRERCNSADLLGRALAHGFSNILTAIYGNIQLIEFHLGTENKALAENIQAVKDGVDKAVSLVNRISLMGREAAAQSSKTGLPDILRDSIADVFTGTSLGVNLTFGQGLRSTTVAPDDVDKIFRAMLYHVCQIADPTSTVCITASNATTPLPKDLPDQTSPYLEIRVESPVMRRNLEKSGGTHGVPDKAVALALSYFYASSKGGLITADTRQDLMHLSAFLPAR